MNYPLGRLAWIRRLLALDRRRMDPRPKKFSRAADRVPLSFRILPYSEIVAKFSSCQD